MANALTGNFGPLAAIGYVQEQGELGRKRGIDNQLNQLASLSYSANTPQAQQANLSQVAALDRSAAADQQKAFQSQQDRNQQRLYGIAQGFKKVAPVNRQAYYDNWAVPQLRAMGLGDQPAYDEAGVMSLADQIIAMGPGGAAGLQPTDVRSFEMMTAGLSPEDRERARRINLGLDGRQSSAAIGYQKVKGPDGIERLVAVDPRQIGAQVVGDGAGYGSFSQPAPMAAGSGGNHYAAFSQLATEFPTVTMTSGARSAERNAQVGGQPNSQHLNGTAADYAVPANQKPAFISRARQLGYQAIDEGDHIHLQLPRGAGGGPNPFAGRRPEDEAAAVEAAKRRVELQYAPALQQVETQGAIDRAAGTAQVEVDAERQKKNQTIMRDARETLSLLDQAETLLNTASGGSAQAARDSVLGAFNVSTEGAKATAGLNVLAAKLVGKVPRFEGPQSDKDVMLYRQAAG
ncbi:D-Ala-D-Ala carboxypeptidase family metallohydrolase, partial [Streptomyces wuyuanensis]|uniref:D-Ala-D-Ala carboxypeptidase family metallohydrolase n=12 Tax=Bacillati TaxID=1783272 RepID=UPI003420A00B